MTDLELTLTEKCARWLKLKYKVYNNSIEYRIEDLRWQEFDPLHNQNDLWGMVVPKLPKRFEIMVINNKYGIYEDYGLSDGVRYTGNLSALPLSILKLVAEIYESETKE
jgi:hypothetical protein